MTTKQQALIIETVRQAVKETVNGKIDNLHKKLDDYIEKDMEWKERAEPLVRAYEGTTSLMAVLRAILKALVLLGGAIGAFITVRKLW